MYDSNISRSVFLPRKSVFTPLIFASCFVVHSSAVPFHVLHTCLQQAQKPRRSLCRGSFSVPDAFLQNPSKISQKYFSFLLSDYLSFRLTLSRLAELAYLARLCPPSPARKSRFSRRFCQKLHILFLCWYIFLPLFHDLFARGLCACVLSGNI